MLVTFSCNAHENITMFGDVAQRLLHLMGHSGTVPSALLAEDIPEALARLEQALDKEKRKPINKLDDDDDGPQVSLVHRALPLIELLQAAVKAKSNVMWK